MSMDLSEFLAVFFEECYEGLSAMESGLLALDAGCTDAEAINTIFRAAHSIKGGSATFGLNEIPQFTHVLETLLDQMRNGGRAVTRDAIDLLLESIDCLREMVDGTKAGTELNAERIASAKKQLENMLSTGDSAPEPTIPPTVNEDPSGDKANPSCWQIFFRPHAHMLQSGNDPYRLFRELANLGHLQVEADLSSLLPCPELEPETCYLAWNLWLGGGVAKEQIFEIFQWVEDDCQLEVKEVREYSDRPEAVLNASQKRFEVQGDEQAQTPVEASYSPLASAGVEKNERAGAGQNTGSIRVSIEKIDVLINLVGELVITQSMLNRFGEDFEQPHMNELRDGLIQLTRNTRELQEAAMHIRMLPIGASFNRFPRLVRDLGNKLGKKVDLRVSGENTELDKTVLEKISDPLVHLVRNALDHGIEPPEVRKAAGKPETGLLQLFAYHQGGNIVIEVKDDGAGINKEKILRKAIEQGLVSTPDALSSDEQVQNLIFQPGFSTAEKISDVSGRGVGMDVVRKNINDLGGHVQIRSEEGKGSTLTIRLPLTLAILEGQLVRIGTEIYVVPLTSIVESLQVEPTRVSSIAQRAELYKLRDEYISIIRLAQVFHGHSHALDRGQLVVVEADNHRVGLAVEEMLGQQQVVIKSLETNFQPIKGVSGATILGDGRVALILDIPSLVQGCLDRSLTQIAA
ncbi:MAG: chemotaxis protein CheA [Gammaproteobacteria bacterium]